MSDKPLGLYIHWPFCKAKCPYCDFNSHVRFQAIDQAEFVAFYLKEMEASYRLSEGRTIASIFFGGGTPSLMEERTVATLLEKADRLWGIEQGAEITLEANPTSSEAARFIGYKAAGVNRLSVGVQSLNDAALKWLGRQHNASEARKAIEMARHCFDRMSFDLIYARQGLSLKAWEDELQEALALDPEHISLYQLTYEEGTAFTRLLEAGKHKELDADRAYDQYELTTQMLTEAGLPPYEISNYARVGEESRHNLLYWRYHDYVGIGPGAHGRLSHQENHGRSQKIATQTERNPEKWADRVSENGAGWIEKSVLSFEEMADEMLVMGLRLAEGVSVQHFEQATGKSFDRDKLSILADEGYIELQNEYIMITPPYRQLSDRLIVMVAESVL